MANIPLKQKATQSFGHYKWVLHLLFWTTLLGISFMQIRQAGPLARPGVAGNSEILLFSIKALIIIILSYTFQFAIVPLYHKPKRYIFWLVFLSTLALAYAARTAALYWLSPGASPSFTGFIFPFTFFVALYYFIDIYDQQKEIQHLVRFKTQKIGLESSFLKSQVNPHFLFNTLNNIYALSLKKSEQTAVIIEKLESLLHYMLHDCKADLVPLENEFKFTDSYIALEKLRHKEDQCVVTVNIKGNPEGKMIAPLLLINFLENAFKHGTKTSFGKSWINLDIDIRLAGIHFKLQNSKPLSAIGQAITEYHGGIGLKNVERRLQILYPERHTLQMSSLKDRFEIDLTINF